jgi:hypothetical protein
MTWLKRDKVPEKLPYELGFLALAGRQRDLSLRESFLAFRDLVSADMDWADSRKRRFRRRAFLTRLTILILTAASTAILGISIIPAEARTAIALPIVALVTMFGSIELFLNHRPIWALMEETQYRLNRVRDEMDYYLVLTPQTNMEEARLQSFFLDQQAVWSDVSRSWVGFRKLDRSSEPGRATPPHVSN